MRPVLILILTAFATSAPGLIVTNLTWKTGTDSAEISWATDKPADRLVEWGVSSNAYLSSVGNTIPRTNHALRISFLSPGARYYFRVSSKDSTARVEVRGVFVTQPIQSDDNLPPSLTIASPLESESISTASVTVKGTAADASGIKIVRVNGYVANGTTNWSLRIPLQTGTNSITVSATDESGSTATTTLRVFHAWADEANNTNVVTAPFPGEQRTLVFLVDLVDHVAPQATRAQVHEAIFDGPLNDFMREQSYGRCWLTGKTLDWITVDTGSKFSSSFNQHHPRFQEHVHTNGVDLSTYRMVLILVNGLGGVGAGTISMPSGFSPTVAIASTRSDYLANPTVANLYDGFVIPHEIGHAMGLNHAEGWECGDTAFCSGSGGSGGSRRVAYGNQFDVMGLPRFGLHFNGYYKLLLDWITPDRVLHIRRSGRYTLHSTEQTNGFVLASVYDTNGFPTPFYLEARRGVGFNVGMRATQVPTVINGQLIPVGSPSDTVVNERGLFVLYVDGTVLNQATIANLLDMDPDPNKEWSEDVRSVALTNRQFDTGGGTVIGPVVSYDETSVTFDVIVPGKVTTGEEELRSIILDLKSALQRLEDWQPL